MALDRQSIEKRDFPVGRRGYDPDAVDAHLSALADEVAQLRRSARSRDDALATSASDRVRAIVEAAETSAGEIRREAEADAREIRDEADAEATATRQSATDRARAYVAGVSESADSMLTRLNAMQTELDALVGALRAGAGRLSSELHALQTELGESRATVAPRADFEPEAVDAPVADEPVPEEDEAPAPDEDDPEAELEYEPEAAAASPADGDALESARLIALNMALDGTPRGQTARYLRESLGISDSGQLLDEVYASVEG